MSIEDASTAWAEVGVCGLDLRTGKNSARGGDQSKGKRAHENLASWRRALLIVEAVVCAIRIKERVVVKAADPAVSPDFALSRERPSPA